MSSNEIHSSPGIAYLVTRSELGGAQTHVLQLLTYFRKDYKIYLLSGELGPLMTEAQALGVECVHIPDLVWGLSPGRDFRAVAQICKALERISPSLLHAHSSKAGVLGRLAAKKVGVPCVFTAHGWAFAKGSPITRKLVSFAPEMMMARITRKIITVSHADRELALKYRVVTRKEKITTIHNGIGDVESYSPPAFNNELPRVIMVARFALQKDHITLLNAFARLTGRAKLVLVGDGPFMQEAKDHTARLGIQDDVEFAGTRTDVQKMLTNMDVFALCTKWEGLPISIIEGMRAGLPILATDAGGIRELVADRESGFLIERGDVTAWVEALNAMISDRSLRQAYGARSRMRFLELFTEEKMLDKTAKVYAEVLAAAGN